MEVQHYREEGDECGDGPDQEEEDGHRPGGEEDDSQQTGVLCLAYLRVIQCVYWSGSLILMYLSSAIMHRLSMEAVEHITSQLR